MLVAGGLIAIGPARPSKPRIKWDGTIYHTVEGAPACLTASRYGKFKDYHAVGDDPQVAAMLEQGVCVLLRPGIEVVPMRRVGSWLDRRLVQVRVVETRQTMVLDESLALKERR